MSVPEDHRSASVPPIFRYSGTPSRARCTRARGRRLALHLNAREEHEAPAAARACGESDAGRKLHVQRQGVESPTA